MEAVLLVIAPAAALLVQLGVVRMGGMLTVLQRMQGALDGHQIEID